MWKAARGRVNWGVGGGASRSDLLDSKSQFSALSDTVISDTVYFSRIQPQCIISRLDANYWSSPTSGLQNAKPAEEGYCLWHLSRMRRTCFVSRKLSAYSRNAHGWSICCAQGTNERRGAGLESEVTHELRCPGAHCRDSFAVLRRSFAYLSIYSPIIEFLGAIKVDSWLSLMCSLKTFLVIRNRNHSKLIKKGNFMREMLGGFAGFQESGP